MIRVVTGHICSGKSTYVRERARPGDVIVDMDRIAQALAIEGADGHDYPEHIIDIARATRWHAIDRAAALHRSGTFDLWIVHAYPTDRDLGFYRRAGAAFIHIDAPPSTLMDRASQGRPRRAVDELARRLAEEGVGQKINLQCHGTPHATSARISVGF